MPKENSTKVEDVKRHVFKVCPAKRRLLGLAPTDKDIGLPDDPLIPTSSPHPSSLAQSTVDLSEWGEQDVAIAAFLMLLWRDMYPARGSTARLEEAAEQWDTWGRPPGGFVDLGCVSRHGDATPELPADTRWGTDSLFTSSHPRGTRVKVMNCGNGEHGLRTRPRHRQISLSSPSTFPLGFPRRWLSGLLGGGRARRAASLRMTALSLATMRMKLL